MSAKNSISPLKQRWKIGLFDSGRGGLTVLNVLRREFPEAAFNYVSDQEGYPYGQKSAQDIEKRALICGSYLQQQEVDLVIIACHTASVYALEALKNYLTIPVMGMTEVAVALGEKAKTVVATDATVHSGFYQNALPHAQVIACSYLVSFAEEERLPPKQNFEGPILLACTHFPLILHAFNQETLDPAEAMAPYVAAHLKRSCLNALIDS
ncbi:MAG: aspartate/glutamate racemase family protein [Verrucomicrobia bacterium]|nr:aspartate/glutamate racemase family protein [Verrucomicrobiota bacterium]